MSGFADVKELPVPEAEKLATCIRERGNRIGVLWDNAFARNKPELDTNQALYFFLWPDGSDFAIGNRFTLFGPCPSRSEQWPEEAGLWYSGRSRGNLEQLPNDLRRLSPSGVTSIYNYKDDEQRSEYLGELPAERGKHA